MDACEEVADTFSGDHSDCSASITDMFSSRLGSLNLSFTSSSYDPAFTFASSRSSSLQHSESTSRCAAAALAAGALDSTAAACTPLSLPFTATVVSSATCPSRRHVHVPRRTSLPDAPSSELPAGPRLSTSGGCWSAMPCLPSAPRAGGQPGSAAVATSTADAPSSSQAPCSLNAAHGSGANACNSGPLTGLKRRSFPEAPALPPLQLLEAQLELQQQQALQMSQGMDMRGPTGDAVSDMTALATATPSSEPVSPTSSFASFAAALAARYYADFGNVPDVPAHIDELRVRDMKRPRVLGVATIADA